MPTFKFMSISLPIRTSIPTQVKNHVLSPTKTDSLKRVKDIKKNEGSRQRTRRVVRVHRHAMDETQQRAYSRLLNAYQLKALKDWYSFSSEIKNSYQLNEAQKFILSSVLQQQSLYPKFLRDEINEFVQKLGLTATQKLYSSQMMNQLVAYEHALDGLISLLVLCRQTDYAYKSLR